MDLIDLFKMAGSLIEKNEDKETTGMEVNHIAFALDTLLGDKRGGLDLASLLITSNKNGLGSIVDSWFANGENKELSREEIFSILDKEKVEKFALDLDISKESAMSSLMQVVPQIVDIATKGEETIVDKMLSQGEDALGILGKILR